MNAITLHQPWATLIALGYKQIETRDWPAPDACIGQPIAIHAGATWNDKLRGQCGLQPFSWCLLGERHYLDVSEDEEDAAYEALPKSSIVALGTLAASRQVNRQQKGPPDDTYEWYFGGFSFGRWLWWLKDIRPLARPIRASGARGIWQWNAPADIELLPSPRCKAMELYSGARLVARVMAE